MKVVLTKDISGVGRRGEVKEFNDGYARNFIVAKGFGVVATEQVLNKIRNEQNQQEAKKKKEQEHHLKMKADLDKRTFTLLVKVGDRGQVFGSVGEKDVAARIKEKTSYEIEKTHISIPRGIKTLGEYEIEIKLGAGITAKPKIKLVDKI